MAEQRHYEWNKPVHVVQGPNTKQNQTKHMVKVFSEFGPYDILCGRGKLARNHIGNKHFRHAVGNRLQNYLDAPTKTEKSEVIDQIVCIIKRKTGRFWKHEKATNGGHYEWIELNKQQTRDKVAHVFRDMVVASRRKSGRQRESEKDTVIEVDDQSIASLSAPKTRAESPDVPKMMNKTDQPPKATPDDLITAPPPTSITKCTFPSTRKNIRRAVGTNHIGNSFLRREAHLEKHFSRGPATNPEHEMQFNSKSDTISEVDDPFIAGGGMVSASRRNERMRRNNENDTIIEVDDESILCTDTVWDMRRKDRIRTCRDMVWSMRRTDIMRSNNQNDSIIEVDDQSIEVLDLPKHKTRQPSTVTPAGLNAVPTAMTTTVTTFMPNNDTSYIGNIIPRHTRHTGEEVLPSRAINPEHNASPLQFDHIMKPDTSDMVPIQMFSRERLASFNIEEPSQAMTARHQAMPMRHQSMRRTAVPVRHQSVRRTETVTKTFVVIAQTSMHSFSS